MREPRKEAHALLAASKKNRRVPDALSLKTWARRVSGITGSQGIHSHEEQTCSSRPPLAVCSALLTAGTFAAAGPRTSAAAGSARLSALRTPRSGFPPSIAAVLHPSLAGPSGAEVLVRLVGQSVAGSEVRAAAKRSLAEQAAVIDRILAVAPSAEVALPCSCRTTRWC